MKMTGDVSSYAYSKGRDHSLPFLSLYKNIKIEVTMNTSVDIEALNNQIDEVNTKEISDELFIEIYTAKDLADTKTESNNQLVKLLKNQFLMPAHRFLHVVFLDRWVVLLELLIDRKLARKLKSVDFSSR